jgi:hypothetical protein
MNVHSPSCCGEIFKFLIVQNKLKATREIKSFMCSRSAASVAISKTTARVILINMSGETWHSSLVGWGTD